MKKGISLIVLVITIIVMIIIAGAIILSLNASNVTARANLATLLSDRANYQAAYAVKYAENTNSDGSRTPVNLADIISTPSTTYGVWSLNDELGIVEFTINSGVDTQKTYGDTIENLTANYSWLKQASAPVVDPYAGG